MRSYLEGQCATNQSIAAVNKVKARGFIFHMFLLFAFHLPPVFRAPPRKFRGATRHL